MSALPGYSNDKIQGTIKRLLDIAAGFSGLAIASPIIAVAALLVVAQDGAAPFYLARRVGKGGKLFRMIKLRSMKVGADRAGIDVVGAQDTRVTKLGWWLRGHKIDELPQLWNVFVGTMSLVGPRPDTPRHIALLTPEEREVINVKPGLTDLASIVYSRLAELFNDSDDLEADYIVRMRPLKSALGVWYVRNWTPGMDILIIMLTLLSIVHYDLSLRGIGRLLAYYSAPESLREAVEGVRRGQWQMRSLKEFGIESRSFASPAAQTENTERKDSPKFKKA